MSSKFATFLIVALLAVGIYGTSVISISATTTASGTQAETPLGLLIKRPETPHGAPIGEQAPALCAA